MLELPIRPRRLRRTPTIRRMVREHYLAPDQLVYPLFVSEKVSEPIEITSMPGVYQHTVKSVTASAEQAFAAGVPAILLFGVPKTKDEEASQAHASNGIVQTAIRSIKSAVPDLVIITDVCLCEYTSHGHCGVVQGNTIANDPSVEVLARVALSHAEAGADWVAPSDMMDGRIGAIRSALDAHGFSETAIMSYAVKYSSAFYGPFREAAENAPQFGDRRSYQMDPANRLEALREAALDVEEGADILLVKPGLAYLDILAAVKAEFGLPTAVYNISGEYAMVKAAARNGWLDEKSVVLEIMTGFRRAGADLILTYWAKDLAGWLKG
ncbi:MAG: porphobilinogen synthase [Verrucomicrobia bacterium]|nr:porphobilinogen synthase [Verrucomicrobiota bacterium]